MSTRITPPIGTRGRFTLRDPFTITNSAVFECKSIRSVRELENDFRNVYEEFYEPYEIDRATYQEDVRQGVLIVSLFGRDIVTGELIVVHVPDTYILGYPNADTIKYHRVVISVDLGLLPETVDVDHVRQVIAADANAIIGKDAATEIFLGEYDGEISRDDHLTLEASRSANIELKETDRAKYLEQVRVNQELKRQLSVFQHIIIDNGLLEEG